MPEGKGTYENLRIEKAENGFSVEYTAVNKMPSRPGHVFDYDEKYESKQELFATGGGVSMEDALDSAINRYKELLMANLGIAPKLNEEEES